MPMGIITRPSSSSHNSSSHHLQISHNAQNTCEFTNGMPIQLIFTRLLKIFKPSQHLWIHDLVAHSATAKKNSRHQLIFKLPASSGSGGPFNTSQVVFEKMWADLQITCESTIRRTIQLILRTLQDISWSSDYLWIHDQVANSDLLTRPSDIKKSLEYLYYEFTGGWPIQLILTRPSNIKESLDYLWIHRWIPHSAYLDKTFNYQGISGLPVNSQVGGPFSFP